VEEGPFDPRQRVVGAVILVVLAVVILPIVLRRPSSQTTGQDVLTVRRSGNALSTDWSKAASVVPSSTGKVVVTGAPLKPVVAKPLKLAVAAGLPAQKPQHLMPAAPSRVPPLPAVHPGPKPIKAASAPMRWYVQVGAYTNSDYAIAFGRSLRAQGFPAHVKLARLPVGPGLVVVLGPYSRAQAQRAKKAVARRDKIQGILMHTPVRAK